MAILSVFVERLREGPLDMDIRVQPAALDLSDPAFTFAGPVTGRVTFHLVGHDVLANGEMRVRLQSPCSRCLNPAETDLRVPVSETWLKIAGEEPNDLEFNAEEPLTRSYSGDEIELDEPLRELIMLELPNRPLCQPECKGLCPYCGGNRNETECACAPLEEEPESEKPLPEWKKTLRNLKLG